MIMGNDTNKKGVAALILARMKPDGKVEDQPTEGEISEGERSCATDLLHAFEAKDVVGIVQAMRSLMEVMGPEQEEMEAPKSSFTE